MLSKFASKELPVYKKVTFLHELNYELTDAVLNFEEFRKVYNDSRQKFDVILAQNFFVPVMYALSERFQAPFIGVSSFGNWIGSDFAMGNPHHPAVHSEILASFNGPKMNLMEKLKSSLYYVWAAFFKQFSALPRSDAIARKYLGDDLPYMEDIEKNMSALFISTNPILHPVQPLVPTVVTLGRLHIQPTRRLPSDLQKLMDNAKNGIVYFSLGSNVKSVSMPENLRKTIISAFSELPYTILWKWESDELPGKPDNVIVRKWLPQQDVLAHYNVRVFISQCGLQSTEEAMSKGVPMIGLPFMGDQELNAQRLEQHGVALALDYLTMTKEQFKNAIVEVVTNEKYKRNMEELRDLLNDEPMSSLERAVWWVEYVIRHKGTRHLRSGTADLSWYEHLLLDVVAVVLLAVFTCLFIFYKFIRFGANLIRYQKKLKTA